MPQQANLSQSERLLSLGATTRLSQVPEKGFSGFKPLVTPRSVCPSVNGTVKGRYVKKVILGHGGLAIVYGATDVLTGEDVALKVYRDTSDSIGHEAILGRAKLISDIVHRNVVRIKNAGVSKSGTFVVMEYLRGHDLLSYFTPDHPLSWGAVRSIASQACEGLKALHDRQIIHKDVKSTNIFIADGGVVKILDFDLSQYKLLEGKTDFGTVTGFFFGTPQYASPEEARGKAYDHRSDIYALGVVMYEAVCGILPFIGANPLITLQMRLDRLPKPPRELRPNLDISPRAESVILKAMAYAPENRFQSMSEMREAILSV
jgi:serine/threonine-protein kinase